MQGSIEQVLETAKQMRGEEPDQAAAAEASEQETRAEENGEGPVETAVGAVPEEQGAQAGQ